MLWSLLPSPSNSPVSAEVRAEHGSSRSVTSFPRLAMMDTTTRCFNVADKEP
jgi:hypothetical protein